MFVGEFVRAGVDVALHLDAVIDVNIQEVPRTEKRELLGIKHGTDEMTAVAVLVASTTTPLHRVVSTRQIRA